MGRFALSGLSLSVFMLRPYFRFQILAECSGLHPVCVLTQRLSAEVEDVSAYPLSLIAILPHDDRSLFSLIKELP